MRPSLPQLISVTLWMVLWASCFSDRTPRRLQRDAWLGPQRLVVLPVMWSPDATPPVSRAALTAAFFGETDSLAAWFATQSVGATQWTGDVLPWRSVPMPPDALRGCHLEALLKAGWDAHRDRFPAAEYDADQNGKIDHVIVVYAGRHSRNRPSSRCVIGALPGVEDAAAIQAQGVGTIGERVPIGHYLHESGHPRFGFPDLYGRHNQGDYGIGVWGLMGLGQWGPSAKLPRAELFAHPTDLEPMFKVRVGWLRPQRITAPRTPIALRPITHSGDVAVIPLGEQGAVWLENRQNPKLPGQGLLVWHRQPGQKIRLIQADGRNDLAHGTVSGRRPLPPNDQNFGDASDPFPGAEGVTAWADPTLGVALEDIRLDGEVVRLTVIRDDAQAPEGR